MLKSKFLALLPHKLLDGLNILLGKYTVKSFSLEGEDLILKRIFGNKRNGFYIDVGAHHPVRFSNTNLFYKRGWRGINIDAMPGSMKLFDKIRSRDINLEIAVSNQNETRTFYAFNQPALNGFSEQRSRERDGQNGRKIIFKKAIPTQRLEKILDDYCPKGQTIDFMSIDVEGFEFEVLQSSNWNKYSPAIIAVEICEETIEEILKSEITKFLADKGYSMFAKTFYTIFYKRY